MSDLSNENERHISEFSLKNVQLSEKVILIFKDSILQEEYSMTITFITKQIYIHVRIKSILPKYVVSLNLVK